MRGCFLLILGFAAGAALVLYLWPKQPAGQAVPAASDLKVTLSDAFLSRAVQNRLSSISFPLIRHTEITSIPGTALVVHVDLIAGPVTAPASMELQPVAQGGTIQVQIVSTNVGGVPIPSQLTGFVADAINSHTTNLLGKTARVTGVEVLSQGLAVTANYGKP